MFDQSNHQLILDSIPHVVWVSDTAGNNLYLNRVGLELLGISEAHVKGRQWLQLLHADDTPVAQTTWQRAAAAADAYACEFRMRWPDASYRWCLARGNRIAGGDLWVGTLTDIDDRHVAEDQLRALSTRLRSVREEESLRISRELHDQLGGSLTAIKWEIDQAAALPEAALRDRLASVSESVGDTVQAVQRIAAELRPSMLDDLGLVDALEWHAHEFERRSGVDCRFIRSGQGAPAFDRSTTTAIFRIVQEAMTNVLRHAGASRVDVTVATGADLVDITVADDGCGFTLGEPPSSGLGLLGMRERASLIGGTLDLASRPGQGTTVRLRVAAPLGRS